VFFIQNFRVLLQENKKLLVQLWIALNIVRLLGEIALIVVYPIASGLKFQSRHDKRERYSEEEKPAKERATLVFIIWALLAGTYLGIYLLFLRYMCIYYRGIKNEEETVADD